MLIEQLEGLARGRPVLEVYEDAHWIDPTTLELLDLLSSACATCRSWSWSPSGPSLCRPGRASRTSRSLTLNRLGRRAGRPIWSSGSTGDKALPAEVVGQIMAKTDGVPLFVEELTKTVLEFGLLADAGDRYELDGPLPPLAIPATLARLADGPPRPPGPGQGGGPDRRRASAASSATSSSQRWPAARGELREALDQLVAAELVFRRGAPPEAIYSFKHALVQDAAYDSAAARARASSCTPASRGPRAPLPGDGRAQPEVLARHRTEAGLVGQAIGSGKGRAAGGERSATTEAMAHLRTALELIETCPEGPERADQSSSSGRARRSADHRAGLRGARDRRGVRPGTRAVPSSLATSNGSLSDTVWALRLPLLLGGKLAVAREAAARVVALGRKAQATATALMTSHRCVGTALLFMLSDLTTARAHMEQALLLYESAAASSARVRLCSPNDVRVATLQWLACTLFRSGPPGPSAESGAGRRVAAALGSLAHCKYDPAASLQCACMLPNSLARPGKTCIGTYAQSLITLAIAKGFPLIGGPWQTSLQVGRWPTKGQMEAEGCTTSSWISCLAGDGCSS